MSVNKVILIGHLGLKHTKTNKVKSKKKPNGTV
jgi:hypothetical protein